MGNVINLRQVRKAKERAEGERRADANRAKYGRTKAEKRLAKMASEKHEAALAGALRERTEDRDPNYGRRASENMQHLQN